MRGQKHIIECRCVLSHLRHSKQVMKHKFVVFSVIDDSDVVVPKYVQCNNCGIVHRVFDLCVSEIVNSETSHSVTTIDDIRVSLPDKVCAVLDSYSVDVATWEAVQFIIENQQWGEKVVLTREDIKGESTGKHLIILGSSLFKVQSFAESGLLP